MGSKKFRTKGPNSVYKRIEELEKEGIRLEDIPNSALYKHDATRLKIRFEREKREISRKIMSERMHLSMSAYFKIETGKTNLDLFRFFQIAEILNIDPKELIAS